MNDEAQSELLDAEFRQILYIIKPLINNIDNHYRLEKYRIWLERLSAVHRSERLERNKYLLALANQIHDGVLASPFTTNPPKGFLPPLQKLKMMIPSEEDVSGHFFQKETQEWPYVTPRHSEPGEQPNLKRVPAKENTNLTPKKKPVKVNPKMVPPFKKIGKAASTGQGMRSRESSWYDLTDTTQGDTDRDEEKKKLSLQHKDEGLKLQEHFLRRYKNETRKSSKESVPFEGKVKCYKHRKEQEVKRRSKEDAPAEGKRIHVQEQLVRQYDEKGNAKSTREFFTLKDPHRREETKIQATTEGNCRSAQDRNEDEITKRSSAESLHLEEKSPRPTEQELEALKMRMKDLLEVKYALRDTHCLTEDRKKTVDALQVKVTHLEQQNAELQELLDSQQRKFLEMDQVKSKELNDFKEKFSLLRHKEIEYLKQYHKKEISALEKSHGSKVSELEAQIACLKKDFNDKINSVTESSIGLMKQKESEIEQLQNQLKIKASQLTNEGNGEQIISLKRCISKLDKVLHKNEKDYIKKLERLKQELEVKDMTNQMQLQTQRADLIIRHAATKQEELKGALNSLEGKYKKMMETLQTRALDAKKQDDKLIEELRILLDHNHIAYMA